MKIRENVVRCKVMEETTNGAKEEKIIYEYNKYPKNVRQIGVPLPGQKIYLEDYVITYLKQCFVHAQEPVVVLLLGKYGEQEAKEAVFLYGAMILEEEGVLEKGGIEQETWDQVHQSIAENFPEAQVLGWACGVPMWSSNVDSQVRRLQKKEFARENRTLFLWDLSEKEEKIFLWQRSMLKEMSGYYVYFEKNPQMQNFMLDSTEPESIDGDYKDTVTVSMRHVIEEKEEHKKNMQLLAYCGAVAAGIALLFGVHTMLDSTARIRKMEQTVDTLTEYVGKQQEDVAAMSRQAQNTEDTVKEIPRQSAKAAQTTDTSSRRKTTEQAGENTGEDAKQGDENAGATAEKGGKNDSSTSIQLDGTTNAEAGTMQSSADKQDKEETDTKTSPENGTDQKRIGAGKSAAGTESKQSAGSRVKKTSTGSGTQSYIVRKGDTLSQIVWRQYHDLSYEKKIKKANGLKDADAIYEGQCIVLPDYK